VHALSVLLRESHYPLLLLDRPKVRAEPSDQEWQWRDVQLVSPKDSVARLVQVLETTSSEGGLQKPREATDGVLTQAATSLVLEPLKLLWGRDKTVSKGRTPYQKRK
jgi:hypothetical protein